MSNITVNTTSTTFGLLPPDLSQYADWLSRYSSPSVTIYQDQSNVFAGMLSISNAVFGYLTTQGYSSYSFVNANELQVTAGSYTVDYYGTFSPSHSVVTSFFSYDASTGLSVGLSGNIIYPGYPLQVAANTGSTLSEASDEGPNPVSPSSNLTDTVALNVTWNGHYWSGTTSDYSESISDTINNRFYQIVILENPTAISFAGNSPSQTGFSTFPTAPTVTGVGINVSNYNSGVVSDTLLVTGFSYSSNSVPASQALPTAISGNDTVSISGAGSFNIIPALVNASSVAISDSAANVVTNLGMLQSLSVQGKLSSITLTDPGVPVLHVTTAQNSNDTLALSTIISPHSVVVPNPGLLSSVNANQQLELIYIAYFNRAADGAGNSFWGGQNVQAQANGQNASVALTNIANSFEPQPETIALYPFLATPNLSLNTSLAQTGLTSFVTSAYTNMFGHAPDTAGKTYWMGQITSGVVGLGAAALAIANGATGADAIEIQNKITVAFDFTTRTAVASLGGFSPLPSSFLTAGRSVLSGVDNQSLNDASVMSGENATTAYIGAHPLGMSASSSDPNVITVTGVNQLIDPGAGSHTIQFANGASADTLVLHAGGVDMISGFDLRTDVLDLRSLLSETNVNLNGNLTTLSNYLTVTEQGSDARVNFDPAGQGGGSMVAVFQGLGGSTIKLGQIARIS